MPIYNPTPASPQPTAVKYVGQGFPNTDPFYASIQAAVDACDGVNDSVVYIFNGTYTIDGDATLVTMKNHVHLIGQCRDRVLLQGSLSHTRCPVRLQPTGTWTVSFRDLTIKARNANAHGIDTDDAVGLWSGGNNTVVLRNCEVWGGSNGAGWRVQEDAVNPRISIYYSLLRSAGSSLPGFRCRDMNSNYVFEGTSFYGVDCETADTGTLHFYRCQFLFRAISGIDGQVFRYYKCRFNRASITGTNQTSNSYTHIFENCFFYCVGALYSASRGCRFEMRNCVVTTDDGADLIVISMGSTVAQPLCRIFNTVFENCRLEFNHAAGTVVLVDTIVRNAGGTNAVNTTATPTIFFGNFTADLAIHAAIVQAAGSFNVQTTVGI